MNHNKLIYAARSLNKYLSLTLLLLNGLLTTCLAQELKSYSETELRALINKSRDKDYKVADRANETLSKLDVKAIPTLTGILQKGKTCERIEAAKIIIDLNPRHKDVVPVLVNLSKGRSIFSSEEDLLCRRGATFLLAFYPEGIHTLTEFLKDKDIFVRRSAIFAFDELTETSNYPEGSMQAMRDAIPVLAETSKDKDKILSEMADEVLGQIERSGIKELSDTAKRVMWKDSKLKQ